VIAGLLQSNPRWRYGRCHVLLAACGGLLCVNACFVRWLIPTSRRADAAAPQLWAAVALWTIGVRNRADYRRAALVNRCYQMSGSMILILHARGDHRSLDAILGRLQC